MENKNEMQEFITELLSKYEINDSEDLQTLEFQYPKTVQSAQECARMVYYFVSSPIGNFAFHNLNTGEVFAVYKIEFQTSEENINLKVLIERL